ncbi:MAG TPA: hypothetical protein DCS82_00705 [Rhodospirillaceae bacterium]|nr:hypothetical protein [Rhodospirillaceae bacterium]HAT34207.1 hypothetical protein [Rhodospirillaceae bacterium]
MANAAQRFLSRFRTIRVAGCRQLFAFLVMLAVLVLPSYSNAQSNQVLRIRAIVNDDVISFYDLIQRIRLLILTSAIPDSPETRRRLAPQVLRAMIDEKLRLQEAARLNIRVPGTRIDKQIALLEERNNLPAGGILQLLDQSSIDENALRNKLKGELAWQSIVRRRLMRQVNISNEEIDDELQRLNSIQHLPQYKVSEIFLSIDNPDQEGQVLEVANRLIGQLDAGAKFALLAREFSQSASAATGGDLGTVSQGQIDPKLEKALEVLEPGGLAGPIRTLAGYYILKLHERVIPASKSTGPTRATISQILLPLKANAANAEIEAQQRIAGQIRADTRTCEQLEKTGSSLNTPQSGSLGQIDISTLPAPIRNALSGLPAKKVSPPIRVAEGLLLMMVCEWDKATEGLPSKKIIRARLGDRRLNLLMQRYMRDLRRTAFIDLRG